MRKNKEKKDTVEKEFVSFPDIAADVINVLLYEGEQITDAGKLLAGPTETTYQGAEKFRSQYEGLCKYELADGKINVMYMIANQSRTDGKMLLRKAGYTGGVYREQYEDKHGTSSLLLNLCFTGETTDGGAAVISISCSGNGRFPVIHGNILMS